ncbi:MAG TPA: hypothetical protein VN719_09400 [Gemmatimonadales bacterium]|nr:hypothetical protein [Gemmatimonadales bacterium]
MDHHGRIHALTATGSVWWVIDQVYRYGPSWSVVPPLFLAIAGLVGAVNGYLNDRQARRHREEEHRLKLKTADTFAGLPNWRPLDPHPN